MIIRAQMVSHGLLPPTSAAARCVQVATGPYTEGVDRHRGSTSTVYGLWMPPGRWAGGDKYRVGPRPALPPHARSPAAAWVTTPPALPPTPTPPPAAPN